MVKAVELLPITNGRLPRVCDAFLAPPGSGDVWSGRAWIEATMRHAIPAGCEAVIALAPGQVLLPLLRRGRSLGSLTTPYTQSWRPIEPGRPGAEALRIAGAALGRDLRLGPPSHFLALDPDNPSTEALLSGLQAEGLHLLRHDHFGCWQEEMREDIGWAGYLATRPAAHRNTVLRKLSRAGATTRFELIEKPGPALEDGIDAFTTVRAGSWKPNEPFPDFDAELMRGLAASGELRLAVLRDRHTDKPLAVQYWIVSGGRALVPKLFHLEAERAASPGTVLTALAIRHLLEVDRVRLLDFGRGDDPYKRLWVTQRRQRIGVLVVDARHPAGLAALLRHAAGSLRRRLRSELNERKRA